MLNWIPYELHNHTNHSDGKHTFEELLQAANDLGLKGLAITDHNTISTFDKIDYSNGKYGINLIKGLEWTTFWGHVLLVGIDEYIDWRTLTLENFNEQLEYARKKSKLIGVAHPYRLGGPIGTGCFFEYEIDDWANIDYIEVWSRMLPSEKQMNKRAYELWINLLNSGLEISAVSGRDWHKSNPDDEYISCTYIGLDNEKDNNSSNIIDAIKRGRCVVGFSYKITNQLELNNKIYNIGDRVEKINLKDNFNININIQKGDLNCKGEINEKNLMVKVKSNLGELLNLQLDERKSLKVSIKSNEQIKWIISELYEVIEQEERMIAFTNPIYFY